MLASAPTGKLNTPRGVPRVLRTGYMGNAVASSLLNKDVRGYITSSVSVPVEAKDRVLRQL